MVVSRETDPFASRVISVTQIHAGDAMNVIPSHAVIKGTYRATSKADMRYLEERITEIVKAQAAASRCTAEVDFGRREVPAATPSSADASVPGGRSEEGVAASDSTCSRGASEICTWLGDGPDGVVTGASDLPAPPPPIVRHKVPAYPPVINDEVAHAIGSGTVRKLLGESAYLDTAPWMAGEDFSFFQEKVPGAMFFLGVGVDGMHSGPNLHSPLFEANEEALPLGVALHVSFVEEALKALKN